MKSNRFIDPLYGEFTLPGPVLEISRCPEVLRLREIRMSSIDLYNYLPFSNTTRYEHALGTAFLAYKVTEKWKLKAKDRNEIIAAALMHDIATPAFSHLTETVFKEFFNYDHEVETAKIILGKFSDFRKSNAEPIFAGELPTARSCFKKNGIDPHNVFDYLMGRGAFGRLIKGKIDLDNIDNVFRASHYMGISFDKNLPLDTALGFLKNDDQLEYAFEKRHLLNKWLEVRGRLYHKLLANTYDFCREAMLRYALRKAVNLGIVNRTNWRFTDQEMVSHLLKTKDSTEDTREIYDVINRIRLGDNFIELGVFWVSNTKLATLINKHKEVIDEVEKKLSHHFSLDIIIHYVLDKRSRKVNNLKTIMETSLFQDQEIISMGVDPKKVLIGIYTPARSLIKRTLNGKALLDNDRKQIRYGRDELRQLLLNELNIYFEVEGDISLFSERSLG